MMYECYFDGACGPMNPYGDMGIGAIIYLNGEVLDTHNGFYKRSCLNSNNVAEYKALVWVLDRLSQENISFVDEVCIYGDSKLVVNQLNRKWNITKGLYVKDALEGKEKFSLLKKKSNNVSITWVPRELNEEADELSSIPLRIVGAEFKPRKKSS